MDLLVGASVEQVRQLFRRINSYTVPLNRQETRHAIFQGEFKWFVFQPIAEAKTRAALMPNARFEVVTGGHEPWLDELDAPAESISAFLSQ